jgi:DNA-binding GntR family transcriptional regulator
MGLEVVRTRGEVDQKNHEHQELFDAVVRGDGDAASAVMLQHINTSLGAKAATRLGVERVVTPRLT